MWRVGVLGWGLRMFVFFAAFGPLIPHFTMGKPITLTGYIFYAVASAISIFPGSALFGLCLYEFAARRAAKVSAKQ